MSYRRTIPVTFSCSLFLLGADDYVVRSQSNLVVLDVSVVNHEGSPIGGLAQDNFHVAENGKPQVIKHFSANEAPVSIGFVIDMSGSMHKKLDGVRHATSTFLDASNPRDEYFLIGFNDRPWVGLPTGVEFSSKSDVIRSALQSIDAKGKTALYDGLNLALQHVVKSRYERRVLVLISDGKDTTSSMPFSDLLQAVRSSPVTIYTIGLFTEDDEDANRGVLKQLARISGGEYYEPPTNSAVQQVCASIARDIRARYTIAYTPPGESSKAGVRKIKVDLARAPGSPKGIVRARSEYVLNAK